MPANCHCKREKQEAPLPLRAQRVRFRYQSKAHMRLPIIVIKANLRPILHRFQVMADSWSNFR